MVGRAARLAAGSTRGLVGAGAVEPSGRAAAATVGTAEVPRAIGCGTGGATQVARLAEARGCRAAEATEVRGWVGARGCRAAEAVEAEEWGGAGCWAERPERKEAWPPSAVARAAVVERSCASMVATRVSHSRWVLADSPRAAADAWSSVRAVAEWRRRRESWERRGSAKRLCSAVASSVAWRSATVIASSCADTRVRASPSSTSWRETFLSSACCSGLRLAQMDARCPRWGGGPVMAREACGSGTVGRKPGMRPVLEPVVARRSVGAMGERSKSGPGAEGGGEAILVVTVAEVPVLGLGDAMVDVVGEDMLLEARKGARGEKSRGGTTRTVKGGWLATCVVTRGVVAEVR